MKGKKIYYFVVRDIRSNEVISVSHNKTIKNGIKEMFEKINGSDILTILYNFDGGCGSDFDGIYDNCYNEASDKMYPIVKKYFQQHRNSCKFESYTHRFSIKRVFKMRIGESA